MSQAGDKAEECEEAPTRKGPALRKGDLYPDRFGALISGRQDEANEFDLVRDNLLLDYSYNTARAYWGDLEHWRDWCGEQEPTVEPLGAEAADIVRYLGSIANAGYSPNTRARRLTALRHLFYSRADNPALQVPAISRRKTGHDAHAS